MFEFYQSFEEIKDELTNYENNYYYLFSANIERRSIFLIEIFKNSNIYLSKPYSNTFNLFSF